MKTMLFNPYTGTPRHPSDIKSDPNGLLIVETDAPVAACPDHMDGSHVFDEAGLCYGDTCKAQAPEPSPTAGMTIEQRILHVGGRTNAASYVEFGSVQAVVALVRHLMRDADVVSAKTFDKFTELNESNAARVLELERENESLRQQLAQEHKARLNCMSDRAALFAELSAAPAQPEKRLTGLLIQDHVDPLTGASIPDPTTFGKAQPECVLKDLHIVRAHLSHINRLVDDAVQPEQPVAICEETHPNNRLLFKRLCSIAGIELGKDSIAQALDKVDRLQQPVVQGDPVLYVSAGQLAAHIDPRSEYGDAGNYIPARKTPEGKFTTALYTHPQPASKPMTDEEFISSLDSNGFRVDHGLAFSIKGIVESHYNIKGY